MNATPVAIWDASTHQWQWEHWNEACAWALAHGAEDYTWRYEIWILDQPFARIHTYALNEQGRRYINPAQGEPAQAPVKIQPLTELPPKHLRVIAGTGSLPGHDRLG